MKIAVLGKNGMLGHTVCKYLKQKGYDVEGTTRKDFDATEPHTVDEYFENKNFDVVINCIGILNNISEDIPYGTFAVNSAFPHFLSQICKRVIHISSDCVVDSSIYGKSKLAGELDNDKDLTIRTSIIGDGGGLMQWYLDSEKPVVGYSKVVWDGVTTLQLAKFIEACILGQDTGFLQYRGPVISKYHVLCLIRDTFGGKLIHRNDTVCGDRTVDYDDPSVQSPSKDIREQLRELERFMRDDSDIHNN